MRFLGRKSSSSGPKAICRRILNKFIPSADGRFRYGREDDRGRLAIPTKLIKLEDVPTSNHMSFVELAMTTVKNRQNKKCRTTLMISDTGVELILNKLTLFTIGLDQVVTCFSLPSEPRAFALVYKRDNADGYCCVSLMLNNALTSLTGWEVWEMLIRKQLFFSVRESNRRLTAQTQLIGHACHDTPSVVSSLRNTLSCASISSLTGSTNPCSIDSSSISALTSITPNDTLSSNTLNSESDSMEETHSISSSKSDTDLSSSGSSVSSSSCQTGTGSPMNESDYSCCSIEGEEACLESDAEASSSGDSNEELNRSEPVFSCSSKSDFSDETEDGSDLSTTNEDDESETLVSAVRAVQPDIQESEGATVSSDSEWSITESESNLSSESDSDSDSDGFCSCRDSTHSCLDDDKGEKSDSESSETESESDSSSDGSQETGSDSDTHSSCGENTHGSDCDERDDTDPNDKMTDSDSDWSYSCCCCVCEECCKQESDSGGCCDSESYSSSGEDTTHSDYDGDDEDDDDSVNCQPASRIASQYSNKILRLIRVQSVGLVVMAVSKAEEDSVSRRKSVEASSSLQMLKRLGKEISFIRVPC